MRWLSIFWTIPIVFITLSTAVAAESDGFRGVRWGSAPAAIESADHKRVEGHMGTIPGVDAFQLTNEDLNFGGIKADSIIYAFFKGKFTSVSIDFSGFSNFEKMQDYCKKLFGPPTGAATLKLEYYASYDAPRTGAVLVYQLGMPTSNYGRLYLYARELMN
jgi:hypothetical protein